mmetsp:Transcript_14449/g.26143  ORF Transcript_14449/g.26143 Transcript_14449/m.26143 type:complete len:879 (-) Transcript_14449:137-2773(-)
MSLMRVRLSGTAADITEGAHLLLAHLAEHVVQDAAILPVRDLDGGVKPKLANEADAGVGGHGDVHSRFDVRAKVHCELLVALQAQGVGVLAVLEAHGHNAHAAEVGAVDALKALGDHSLDPLQVRPLGSPVPGRPAAVLLAGQDDQGVPLGLVLLRGVEHGHGLPRRDVHSHGPGLPGAGQFVGDAGVGEGAPGHDQVVAAAGAVRVELGLGDVAGHQPLGGGGRLGDVAGRGDVVRGDGVPEVQQAVGPGDGLHLRQLRGHAGKVRRVVDVRAALVPPEVHLVRGGRELVPALVALLDPGVHRRERGGRDVLVHQPRDLLRGGPHVLQVHVLAVRPLAQRRGGDVQVGGPRQRVHAHQRGAREVVAGGQGVHARLKVAVAGQHGRADQAGLLEGLVHAGHELPAVADAGHAPVPGGVEALGVQVLLQAAVLQVLRDDLTARGQRCLDVGLSHQPQLLRLLAHEPGRQQHRRIGRVGAAGDGGNHHVPVVDRVFLALVGQGAAGAPLLLRHPKALEPARGRHALLEVALQVLARDVVVRPLGPGHARQDGGHVQLQGLQKGDGAVSGLGTEHAHLLEVLLHHRHVLGGPPGLQHVLQRALVHGEEAAGGAVLGAHVGDGGAVRHRQVGQAGAVELHELAHDPVLAEVADDGQDQVRGGGAGGELAGQLVAHHAGQHHGHGGPQHGRLRLDPSDTPAQDPQAVDHGGVGVRAHQAVGVHQPLVVEHHPGEVLHVHLMHNAVARGHNGQTLKGGGAPLQEGKALFVALEFTGLVLLQSVGRAGVVDHNGVVDDQVHRHNGVDLAGVAPQLLHGVPHRRQVNHRRHPCEILHQHSRTLEWNLHFGGTVLPVQDLLNIGLENGLIVTVADGSLQDYFDGQRK